jgi:hypothetical protein
MSIKMTGLDEFQKKLDDLKNRVESISGERSIPLNELMTPDFLAACSTFSSAEELFERSGFKVESQEDFAAIPDEPWDEFIRVNTSYFNWQEMLQAAGAAWAKAKLNL